MSNQVARQLTDPQYAVVKQVRTPVAVVIAFQDEGVNFMRSKRVPRGILTGKEFSGSRLHDRIGIAESGLFVVRCEDGWI